MSRNFLFVAMKTTLALFLIVSAIAIGNVSCKWQCQLPPASVPLSWITMKDPCIKRMREQVQVELKAAVTYLAMGAHFSKDSVNRPGFAKFFFDSASEEREHAIKIISYLLMRGELTTDLTGLIKELHPLEDNWEDGVTALRTALKLEADVTQKIRKIISVCEAPTDAKDTFNDYHLVDYLSGDFLEEQYKGQRDLAGKISTLGKMMDHHGALGEFLFDKKLLNGEPL